MQQSEYLVISVSSKHEGATMLRRSTGKKLKFELWGLATETLNALGEEGWDVVATQYLNQSDIAFTLRRAKL